MAYIGINNTARKITDIYIGVDGVARKVTKAYIGVDGIARQWWGGSSSSGGGDDSSLLPTSATLASADGWFLPSQIESSVYWLDITFVSNYQKTGKETCSWNGGSSPYSVTCYLVGNQVIIDCGYYSGVFAHAYSNDMFYPEALNSNISTTIGIKSINNLSKLDTSKVKDMLRMFQGAAITTVDVSNWDTSQVTRMQKMFYNCYNLTTLDVSNWDTGNVTNMQSMFEYCPKLTTIDPSGWNTSNVTNMGNMFANCESLTTLDLRGWDTSNVTSMAGMFSYCPNLTQILVTEGLWVTDQATTTGMFYGCGVSSVTYA